jgi:DNA polymerase-3 subunit epsilon
MKNLLSIFSRNSREAEGTGARSTATHGAAPIGTDLPISGARYVVFDTELTGLDERVDSIVSIGAVRMEGSRIMLGESFASLVKPRTSMKGSSVVVHGITPDEVADRPAFAEVLATFLEYLGEDILVGHHLSIDLAFLEREISASLGVCPLFRAVDTAVTFDWLNRQGVRHRCFRDARGSLRLADLAACFGIDTDGAHRAEMDAFITAQLFQRLLPLLASAGITTVRDLMKVGAPREGGGRGTLSAGISNF